MSDFPLYATLFGGSTLITPVRQESIGSVMSAGGVPTSTAWGTANLALYIPFRLSRFYAVKNVFLMNGATVSGNADIGIYDASGTRLASTGSTAQSGTNASQKIALTITLTPGQYWMALAMSSATATVFTSAYTILALKALGCYQQASAFALPATATFATSAGINVPMFGLTSGSVV